MPITRSTISDDFSSSRARKQLTLFLAGASFFTLSTLITRRAVHRKHIWPKPRFYDFSNAPPSIPIIGSVEALEALQIATLNVFSFGIMIAGGLGWSFNISRVQELKTKVAKKRPPVDVNRDPGAEEKELEGLPEWIVGMMGGKDSVVVRAKEMQRRKGVDEIRSRGGEQKADEGTGKVLVDRERIADKKEKPWWKGW